MSSLSPNLRGIIFMVLATGSFVINDTMLKLATDGLPPFETLFLRGIFASLWSLPLVLLTGNGRRMMQAIDRWVLLRNLCELVAVLCFIVALKNMPLADITAINQTAPMLLLIGCAIFFGDRIGPLRMVLIALGFLGALLVAQPGGSGISPYALLGFACAIAAAARDIVGRNVGPMIPAVVVAYSMILLVMAGAGTAHLLFEDFVAPSTRHLLLLGGAGLFLSCGQVLLFLSYRTGATGAVAPFLYMFAVWAVISGVVVFNSLPDPLAIAGIALILFSGVTVALLDERKRRLEVVA
jgi:drug/metabolite transporter (DMT)-like permease